VSKGVEGVSSVADSAASIGQALADLTAGMREGEPLYFYLVDEFTMKPVVPKDNDGVYLKISTQSDFMKKVMPMLKLSMKAIYLLNGVAGLMRCLGCPVPILSDEAVAAGQGLIGSLDQASSVAEFDFLQQEVDEAAMDPALSPRGAGPGYHRSRRRRPQSR
jgi:hypothetical protein